MASRSPYEMLLNAGMFDVPSHLRRCPVRREEALSAGISRDVLEGAQFRRLHEAVYCHRDHVMTWEDEVLAARLALPSSARTTGATRLRELGIAAGPARPLHFVVEGDLHLRLTGVFLHRTVRMPPADEHGVAVEAAFLAFCAEVNVLDAVATGSFLLYRGVMSLDALESLITEQPWRRGSAEAAWVLPHLDGRCRSIPEAELLACVRFAGLPEPDVNRLVELAPGVLLTPDLWWAVYRAAAEYEGAQHQEDRAQYNADIDRYALYRRHDVEYVQVTKERMRSPRATVRAVHAALVARGYEGPMPDFGPLWSTLHTAVADVVRPGRRRSRSAPPAA